MRMIGIIDYGMGNLRSVQKAFEQAGAYAAIMLGPQSLAGVAKLILPGVGAFADGMAQLRQREWIEPIEAFIESGKPFLGICLGMQLLFESSQEDAPLPDQPVPGLAVLPGRVVRFREDAPGPGQPHIKVPHMGWNTLAWQRADPLLAGLDQGCAVYFVHSYYAQPEYPSGQRFCASIWRANVWATQFHPEKSQRVGLRMIENFAAI
jgi:glutamine amidotransferase